MLNNVIGQETAKQYLTGASRQNRLAHAYMLTGEEGWGSEELALEFSRYLLCEQPDNDQVESCGKCRACLQSRRFQHPDLHYYFPVLKSLNEDELREKIEEKISDLYAPLKITGGSIHIGDPDDPEKISIRSLIRESSVRSFTGGKKIFIVTFAEQMNAEAANAFLKILEEPLFFLTTARPNALLPTILSRCQSVRLQAQKESDVVRALESFQGITHEQAVLYARLSEGNYGRAVRLLKGNLEQSRDLMLNFLLAVVSPKPADLMRFLNALIKEHGKDKETAVSLLTLMLTWFQDANTVIAYGGMTDDVRARITNHDKADRLSKFAARFSGIPVSAIAQDIEKAVDLILRNVYLPLVMTHLALALRRRITEPAGVH